MDVEALKTISDTILSEGKEIIATWLEVVSNGHKGIGLNGVGLHGERALSRAVRFMLYMSFVSVLFQVPAAALIGVQYENKYYELVSVLEQFISYLGCGVCFHLAMKWLGGKAVFRDSFAVTCFLTAYSPLLDVFLTPLRKYTFPVLKQTSDVGSAAVSVYELAQRWSLWEWIVFVASFVATTVVFALFFVAVFRSFRALHHLPPFKAGAAFAIGLVMFVFFVVVFLAPLDDLILKAFSRA
jgi:hypothetical protein